MINQVAATQSKLNFKDLVELCFDEAKPGVLCPVLWSPVHPDIPLEQIVFRFMEPSELMGKTYFEMEGRK